MTNDFLWETLGESLSSRLFKIWIDTPLFNHL